MVPFKMTHCYDQAPRTLRLFDVKSTYNIGKHIVSQSVQKYCFVDIEFYASGKRTMCRMHGQRIGFSSQSQEYHPHSLLNITSETFVPNFTRSAMLAYISCINVSEEQTSN